MNKIWIIEDNPDFRAATARGLLASTLECEVDQFSCCEDAIGELDADQQPTVILMDIGLPGIDGITGIGEIKSRVPECSILILTVFEDDDKIFRALKAGASGYLLKSESLIKVNEAIELVLEGAAPINPRIASRVLAMFAEQPLAKPDYGLTDREKSVLDCMSRGLVRKQTAIELALNIHTVDYVMRRIYKKLHVNGATEAVALAVRDGLL